MGGRSTSYPAGRAYGSGPQLSATSLAPAGGGSVASSDGAGGGRVVVGVVVVVTTTLVQARVDQAQVELHVVCSSSRANAVHRYVSTGWRRRMAGCTCSGVE